MSEKNYKIFIVDDDAMYTMFMEDHLKSRGHSDISSYSTGEACLENLDKNPEIILLDYNLNTNIPGARNGQAVLEEIRKQNKEVVVIMISAQESYKDRDKGQDEFLYFIVKGKESFNEIDRTITNLS